MDLYRAKLDLASKSDIIDMSDLRNPGLISITIDGTALIKCYYQENDNWVEFFSTSVTGSVQCPIADTIKIEQVSGSSTKCEVSISQEDQGLTNVLSKVNPTTGRIKTIAGPIVLREGDDVMRGVQVIDWSAGTFSKISAGAGESASLAQIAGENYAKCTVSTTAGALFGADLVLTEPVYIGQCETLQIPIYFDNNLVANLGSDVIQLWIYTAGTGTNVRPQIATSNLRPGEVNIVSFSRDSVIAGATPITQLDADRIDKIRIYITSGSAPSAVADERSFYIGPIRAGARRKGRVVWYLDGEYDSQHKYILPMMDRLGLRASMMLVNANLGQAGYMTESQVLSANDRGHMLGHHTFGSATGGYGNSSQWPTEESIYNDIISSWSWLSARGANNGIGHAAVGYVNYWTGSVSKSQSAAISSAMRRAGVKTLRRGGAFMAAPGGVGCLQSIADPRRAWTPMIGGRQVTSTTTVADLKAVIDAAEKRGELANILIHKSVLDSATPGSLEIKNGDLAQVLSYAADRERAGGILNQTIAEAYEDCSA